MGRTEADRDTSGIDYSAAAGLGDTGGTCAIVSFAENSKLNLNNPLHLAGDPGRLNVAMQVFAMTLMDVVPSDLAVLACVVFGLIGPPVVWAAVLLATRSQRKPGLRELRRPAAIGIGIVFATEVGFYVPLGFFAIALQ